jgi:exodeoxyribonuclease-3
MQIILDWLAAQSPDVLCVQETKVQDVDFPADEFARAGYQVVFKGEPKYNGVAILSTSAAGDVEYEFDGQPDDQARFLKAIINGVTVINTYVPQGFDRESEKFRYKLRWLAALGEYFKKHHKPADPIVWVGDFNSAMQARDVHDPDRLWGHVCYCQEVRQAFTRIFSWGFQDLFRKHCDQDKQYTFWDYREMSFQRNNGWRLDYIMAAKSLADRCTRCWIDTEPRRLDKPSDHTFLAAEFDV